MLDYKGIEALYTVLDLQSFEAAAKRLHITQSAVSQRIKSLETLYGEPLMVRVLPYQATELGTYLVGHYKRVSLLEDSLTRQIGSSQEKPHISIALNRDSLETWFLDLIEQREIFSQLTLEIIADDQELTLDYFKKGVVSACLSTSSKALIGADTTFLGDMEYLLVASPPFIKTYFPTGTNKANLLKAPAIKFDQNDRLHERYLEKFFDMSHEEIHFHSIPSVQGFKKFAKLGYGYALIPKIDILNELKQKELIPLSPKTWKIPLYWHYWAIESEFYQIFNAKIIQLAKS